ncbi:MAG: general stress protein [Kovacikia sp.]
MTFTNNKRAVGIFSSHQEAENALHELRDDGFAMNQVSIVAKDPDRLDQSHQIGETHVQELTETTPIARDTDRLDRSHGVGETHIQELTETTHVDEGAKIGFASGGAVGGLTGLLVGLGTLAIPGVGPIMLAGASATAISTTLAGGAIGAAAGGLVGGLVGLGIPEERAHVYHNHVVRGGDLIIVDGTEVEILRAEAILRRRGIREWEVYPASTTEEVHRSNGSSFVKS